MALSLCILRLPCRLVQFLGLSLLVCLLSYADAFQPQRRPHSAFLTRPASGAARDDVRRLLRGREAGRSVSTSSSGPASSVVRHAGPSVAAAPVGSLQEAKKMIYAYVAENGGPSTSAIDAAAMENFMGFVDKYTAEVEKSGTLDPKEYLYIMTSVLKASRDMAGYEFEPYHTAIRQPLDLYKLGNDLFRPLVDLEKSKLEGVDQLQRVRELLDKGENVIFLSNHQSEADPQLMSLLFEHLGFPELGEKIVCVAGHRVTSDPLTIPFSMGRNLLCINSKRHLDNPPELKEEKQRQNIVSMQALSELLAKGGFLLWVAPSGGRDRPDENGEFVVAPFDPKAVQMFNVLAKKARTPTHFFPVSLWCHPVLPPPTTVSKELGEVRTVQRSPVGMAVLPELESPTAEKASRNHATEVAQQQVEEAYQRIRCDK